jgi:hypothetical protein
MKAYEGFKPWSLLIDINGFTHELNGPRTNNILLITWGQTTSQEMLKFPIIGPKFGLDFKSKASLIFRHFPITTHCTTTEFDKK